MAAVVTIGALLLIGLMMALGYQRGVARLGVAFGVLLISSLLARPLHPMTGWLVSMFGAPKLLVPTLATLATGCLIFVLLLVPAMLWVKKSLGQGER